MCELLGLSSRLPTTVTLSMRLLAQHGNAAHHLGDGWGVAFHTGNDALVIKQPEAASDSPWVEFLEKQRVRAHSVIAHIRHATQGEVSLRNTQPFSRELGGRMHVFAHNGKLAGIEGHFMRAHPRFRSVGTTDSEVAFCALMERMAVLWDSGTPPAQQRVSTAAGFAVELHEYGPANFLYTDGELLIAHGHRRTQQDGRIIPPGLWTLTRSCREDREGTGMAGLTLQGGQLVTLFASVPLTDEAWRPLEEGEIMVVCDGVALPAIDKRKRASDRR